jgi:hypothetical protein
VEEDQAKRIAELESNLKGKAKDCELRRRKGNRAEEVRDCGGRAGKDEAERGSRFEK